MKKLLLAAVAAIALTGCAGTNSVIREYDATGKVTKVTETNKSVVESVTAATKDKTVVVWESGWAAYISASTATTQDPTPTVKMFAGKTDKGIVSALKDQANWDGIASAINATKYELSVTKDGVGSTSVKTDKTTATTADTTTK